MITITHTIATAEYLDFAAKPLVAGPLRSCRTRIAAGC